jgi:PPOX class probable F420-dependent enzyme
MIDMSTEFGARAARRLREEIVVWLTTVTPQGAPVPNPVWFVWDGDRTVRLHSLPGMRVRNIEADPRVSLNFDGNGEGGDIVVLSGRATVDPGAPPANEDAEYLGKYGELIPRLGLTPQGFAARYSTQLRIDLERVRGH